KDIRLWESERTQEEISANMNDTLAGDETGLTLYYPMQKINEEGEFEDLAGDNNASITGDLSFSLSGDWQDTGYSTPEYLLVKDDSRAKGGKSLVLSGQTWYYKEELIEYNADGLYRVEARVRQDEVSDENRNYFLLGVEGLGGGDKLINAYGEQEHTDQFFSALMYEELEPEEGWQTFTGYFSGESRDTEAIMATISGNNPSSSLIQNPTPLYKGVKNIRPVFAANLDQDTDENSGIARIDYIKIERLDIE
ncbi:MAG: hypothetical protein ACOC5A_03235, partial [Halanaerobiales bacterium]